MTSHYEQYAIELVDKHGVEHALRIMERCLETTTRTSNTLFFDEAEFNINELGNWEMNRNQPKKKVTKHEKRIKQNINFYKEVISIIKKGSQNVTKS